MQMSHEITSMAELRRSCSGDGLLLWASQGLPPGRPGRRPGHGVRRVRAWRRGDAVAVAAPFLSCRDRLAIHGPADQVAPLVRDVLAEVGTTFRLIGSKDLVAAVADRIDELALLRTFGWMETDRPAIRTAGGSRQPAEVARWLDWSWSAPVAELLAETYPGSYARPGLAGVRRWAGAVPSDGILAAVAADAWSAPDVGYIAGVVVRTQLQGQGYAAAAFRLVLDTLVAEHGRAALMVAAENAPAVRLYRQCGLSWRSLAAAGVVSGHSVIRGDRAPVAERISDQACMTGSGT
ncbi:GNAT family N-acetyltransferase [Actinopolymorpha sp. B9G3]|uniref:GNAT family N-acetyltransferase n=1 Tax=Actinopolymorpha sp. B9G3 TaxID=3158970 RepID=UPI0032D9152A